MTRARVGDQGQNKGRRTSSGRVSERASERAKCVVVIDNEQRLTSGARTRPDSCLARLVVINFGRCRSLMDGWFSCYCERRNGLNGYGLRQTWSDVIWMRLGRNAWSGRELAQPGREASTLTGRYTPRGHDRLSSRQKSATDAVRRRDFFFSTISDHFPRDRCSLPWKNAEPLHDNFTWNISRAAMILKSAPVTISESCRQFLTTRLDISISLPFSLSRYSFSFSNLTFLLITISMYNKFWQLQFCCSKHLAYILLFINMI